MKRSFRILIAVAVLSSLTMVGAVMAQESDPVSQTGTSLNESDYPEAPASEMPPTTGATEERTAPPATEPAADAGTGSNENSIPPAPPVPTLYDTSRTEVPPTTATPPKPSAQGELKKIEHPDLIRFFTKIRQVGNSLYGVMKDAASSAGSGNSAGNSAGNTPASGSDSQSQGAAQQLEKILRPDLIKFYASIKKIGNSLFGVRVGKPASEAVKRPVVTAEQSACVISAIEAKDQTVIAAKTAEAEAFKTAVTARTACQTSALGNTEGQTAALAKCVADFAKSSASARETFSKAQNEAWKKYVAALKSCAPSSSTGASAAADIMVEDGGNN